MRPDSLEIPCATCGAVAMHVRTTAPGDPLDMPGDRPSDDAGLLSAADGVLTAIGGTTTWIAASMVRGGQEAVGSAIRAGDLEALLRLDPEIVPLYCPSCGVAYCRAHWKLWDQFDPDDPSWYDETRGLCPQDHERRIFD